MSRDTIYYDNIKKLENFIKAGCKSAESSLRFGVELEHFIVERSTKRAVPYAGEHGVGAILEELAELYEEKIYSEGCLIGLKNKEYVLTLEPASQIEISMMPKEDVEDIKKIYDEFRGKIEPILDRLGYELVEMGYQPASKTEDIALIPKERYEFMDRYFAQIGDCGRYMMRGTASTQVSIDYFSEEDFIQKYRAAYILTPIFSLICDHSPVFEGAPNTSSLLRMKIWEGVDKDRVDISEHITYNDISFEKYAEFVYHVPMIVNIKDGQTSYTTKSAAEIYADTEMEMEDVEHALSMVFPDVRAKNYIEIRCADSLPIEQALKYVELIKGLFSDMEALQKFMDELGVRDFKQVTEAKHEIMKKGMDAEVYGKKVKVIIDELYKLAKV